jgi:hypothetical protein
LAFLIAYRKNLSACFRAADDRWDSKAAELTLSDPELPGATVCFGEEQSQPAPRWDPCSTHGRIGN